MFCTLRVTLFFKKENGWKFCKLAEITSLKINVVLSRFSIGRIFLVNACLFFQQMIYIVLQTITYK